MSRNTNTLIIEVDGREVTLDIEADTASVNLDEDMVEIAPQIAWYGRLLAAARHRTDLIESNIKRYKAIATQDIQSKAGGKLAEWKVRAEVDALPALNDLRQELAQAWEVANRLDSASNALKVKAEMLRSRGAMMRAEWGSTSMVTKSEQVSARTSKSDKVAATKRALKGA